ncbi:GSCOCG00007950001-RA-CDS [Cotesia congregata]|nr:GSCOCG00007950001-RA-CDS [Cotesia congregata]
MIYINKEVQMVSRRLLIICRSNFNDYRRVIIHRSLVNSGGISSRELPRFYLSFKHFVTLSSVVFPGGIQGCWVPYTSIQNECKNTPYDYKLTGGIELVPLLTARKCHSNPIKYITTDATRPGYILDSHRSLNIENRDYTAALSEQISRKRERILEEKRLEQESCRRHFDTWRKLWGRPGHGAPIDHAYRNDLHAILYRAVPRVY